MRYETSHNYTILTYDAPHLNNLPLEENLHLMLKHPITRCFVFAKLEGY